MTMKLPLKPDVFLILMILIDDDAHGYGIIKHVEEKTSGRLELEAGTLYAAIKRMRDDTLIAEAKAPSGTDSRRRYYGLTPFGRSVLRAQSPRPPEPLRPRSGRPVAALAGGRRRSLVGTGATRRAMDRSRPIVRRRGRRRAGC